MLEQNLNNLMAEANKLLAASNTEAAVSIFQQVVDTNPDLAMAWLMLGKAQLIMENITDAESSCKRAIKLQPTLANAHFLLGNILESSNNAEEAAECYEKSLELEPGNTMAITRLGIVRHHQGALDTAIEHYRHALQLNPYLSLAHFNMGVAFNEQKLFSEAENCFRTVIKLQNNYPRAHAYLGYVTGAQKKKAESVAAYKQALKYEQNNAALHHNIGLQLIALGLTTEGEECLRTAIHIKPDYTSAYIDLASLLQSNGNFTAAETTLNTAISYQPASAEAYQKLATVLSTVGRQDEAVACCEKALHIKPDYVDAHIAMSAASITLQQSEIAQEHCKRALEIEPSNINAIALSANLSNYLGDKKTAYQILQPLLTETLNNADPNRLNVALTFAQISKEVGKQDEAIELLERILHNPSLQKSNRINLLFNLGKLYDATGEYDKAFSSYEQGNALKPLVFDAARHAAEVETIISTYTPNLMMRLPRSSILSDRPVFVVGMARSGTSLVEQILSSHPQIYGAGELMDVVQMPLSLPSILNTRKPYPQCLPLLSQDIMDRLAKNYFDTLYKLSPDAYRVVDKMPGNFMHLGLIQLLFPNARVIHCSRDPLDTCLSCYFQDFSRSHPYSYNMENLGAFYKDYRKIMRHWKSLLSIPMVDVKYEELVQNQEEVSRSLIEFCGLEWDEQCLQFHKTNRFVGTASYDQVRQPIYTKSAGRWKHYEKYLEPLRQTLQIDHTRAK